MGDCSFTDMVNGISWFIAYTFLDQQLTLSADERMDTFVSDILPKTVPAKGF